MYYIQQKNISCLEIINNKRNFHLPTIDLFFIKEYAKTVVLLLKENSLLQIEILLAVKTSSFTYLELSISRNSFLTSLTKSPPTLLIKEYDKKIFLDALNKAK